MTSLPIMDYIITVSGSIMVLLISAIAYFLRQFAASVNTLKETVEKLNLLYSVQEERVAAINTSLAKLDSKYNILRDRVDDQEKDILIIRTKIDD